MLMLFLMYLTLRFHRPLISSFSWLPRSRHLRDLYPRQELVQDTVELFRCVHLQPVTGSRKGGVSLAFQGAGHRGARRSMLSGCSIGPRAKLRPSATRSWLPQRAGWAIRSARPDRIRRYSAAA